MLNVHYRDSMLMLLDDEKPIEIALSPRGDLPK